MSRSPAGYRAAYGWVRPTWQLWFGLFTGLGLGIQSAALLMDQSASRFATRVWLQLAGMGFVLIGFSIVWMVRRRQVATGSML